MGGSGSPRCNPTLTPDYYMHFSHTSEKLNARLLPLNRLYILSRGYANGRVSRNASSPPEEWADNWHGSCVLNRPRHTSSPPQIGTKLAACCEQPHARMRVTLRLSHVLTLPHARGCVPPRVLNAPHAAARGQRAACRGPQSADRAPAGASRLLRRPGRWWLRFRSGRRCLQRAACP